MDRLITEHTTGQLVTPDGALLSRPTRVLTANEAGTLRQYFRWALQAQLEPELLCGQCFDHSRDTKATYEITDNQITIICGCQIRFSHGVTPGLSLLACTPSPVLSDEAGPAVMTLSRAVAVLLREYKTAILVGLDLREALRCNACFELGMSDGCEAQVTSKSVRIRCRCTTRTFVGSTN